MSCTCGARAAHFKCASCGMHVLLDNEPCPACFYFRFETVAADTAVVAEPPLDPVTPPVAAPKQAKRRPRGAADSTQRN